MRQILLIVGLTLVSNFLYAQKKMVIDIEKYTINGLDARYLTDDWCIKAFGIPDKSNKFGEGKSFIYKNLGLEFFFKGGINSKINIIKMFVTKGGDHKNYLEVGRLNPDFKNVITVTDIKNKFKNYEINSDLEAELAQIGYLSMHSKVNKRFISIEYDLSTGVVSNISFSFVGKY